MTYQYNYPSFGTNVPQLGNNFGFGGGFGGNNGFGTVNGTGTGGGQTPGFFDGASGIDLARLGIGGLQTGFNIFGGLQANRLAKQQFDYTKRVTDTNLNNSIQTYNTKLEDRARSRASIEGSQAEDTQAYIERNRLTRS